MIAAQAQVKTQDDEINQPPWELRLSAGRRGDPLPVIDGLLTDNSRASTVRGSTASLPPLASSVNVSSAPACSSRKNRPTSKRTLRFGDVRFEILPNSFGQLVGSSELALGIGGA